MLKSSKSGHIRKLPPFFGGLQVAMPFTGEPPMARSTQPVTKMKKNQFGSAGGKNAICASATKNSKGDRHGRE
jgi:hypothetical protein